MDNVPTMVKTYIDDEFIQANEGYWQPEDMVQMAIDNAREALDQEEYRETKTVDDDTELVFCWLLASDVHSRMAVEYINSVYEER